MYTKIDLRGAYNLVRIQEGDKWKTTFQIRYDHFKYNVMPFGVTNAPAVFQHMMNDVFKEFLDDFVVIYIDDILIYFKNIEDHEKHVHMVLKNFVIWNCVPSWTNVNFSNHKLNFLDI